MADEPRKCIACGGPAHFTVNLVFYRLGASPKVTASSQAVGVCRDCCQPDSKSKDELNNYRKLGRCVAVMVWQGNNDLERKLADRGPSPVADRKSAAAGDEA